MSGSPLRNCLLRALHFRAATARSNIEFTRAWAFFPSQAVVGALKGICYRKDSITA